MTRVDRSRVIEGDVPKKCVVICALVGLHVNSVL